MKLKAQLESPSTGKSLYFYETTEQTMTLEYADQDGITLDTYTCPKNEARKVYVKMKDKGWKEQL